MRAIGYSDAVVVYGEIKGSYKGMDEASVCGESHAMLLKDGVITPFSFMPEDVGVGLYSADCIAMETSREKAAEEMYELLGGKGEPAKNDAVIVNSSLIFYVQDMVPTLKDGVELARELLMSGKALETLGKWVLVQNRHEGVARAKLEALRDG